MLRLDKELGWCNFCALRWDACVESMWNVATDCDENNMLRVWGLCLGITSCWMLQDNQRLEELQGIDSVRWLVLSPQIFRYG